MIEIGRVAKDRRQVANFLMAKACISRGLTLG